MPQLLKVSCLKGELSTSDVTLYLIYCRVHMESYSCQIGTKIRMKEVLHTWFFSNEVCGFLRITFTNRWNLLLEKKLKIWLFNRCWYFLDTFIKSYNKNIQDCLWVMLISIGIEFIMCVIHTTKTFWDSSYADSLNYVSSFYLCHEI